MGPGGLIPERGGVNTGVQDEMGARLLAEGRQGHRSTGSASTAASVSSFAEPAYSCLACSINARAWSGWASRMPVSKLDAAVKLGIVTTAWDSEATKNRSGSRI